jgi:hypothetical protein
MPNKRSCRACGNDLTPTTVCNICNEYIKWLCRRCTRMDDVTHVHTFPNLEHEIGGNTAGGGCGVQTLCSFTDHHMHFEPALKIVFYSYGKVVSGIP